jgi:cyclase
MLRTRVIPCLLLRRGGLVKTLRFADPKYVGDPINAVRIFNDKEADELMVLDIMATREGTGPDFALIEQFAGECFMPLCYGGGIRTPAEARRLSALGVEKVCLQTAALDDLSVVTAVANDLGSQSVVVCIDIKRDWLGRPHLYRSATGRTEQRRWIEYARAVAAAGAGELVVNSVDRDGTMRGMDLDVIRDACAAVSIPVIALGGAGSLADIKAAADAGANGVAAGAFFVFHGPHRAVLITYPSYKDLEKTLTTR